MVSRLQCSLVETTGRVRFSTGSRLRAIYGEAEVYEKYRCNYGLNEMFRNSLESSGLRFTGTDDAGDARAFELPAHPFFCGSLFQPERYALNGELDPLIRAFVSAI